MNLRQFIIALWFFSMAGILTTNAVIFYNLFLISEHKIVLVLSEPSKIILYIEVGIIFLLIITNMWLMYFYLIKQHYLDIVKQ